MKFNERQEEYGNGQHCIILHEGQQRILWPESGAKRTWI
jgi:hypothetical protein